MRFFLTPMAKLPTAAILISSLPCEAQYYQFIQKIRQEISDILSGKNSRMLVIVGPCSIHDLQSATEYAQRLKTLSKSLEDTFLIIMRTYFEKARSVNGWKGFLYDPDLDQSHHINKGLTQSRQFLLELASMNLPAATEFLDPNLTHYYSDLISWGSIGARTSSSQIHRQMASNMEMPIAFKNHTSGNPNTSIDAMEVAQSPHHFAQLDTHGYLSQVSSQGNANAHIVLRGGEETTNYDFQSVNSTLHELRKRELNPHLIIDCSHGNCRKDYYRQRPIFQEVLEQRLQGNHHLIGVMLESHLQEACQAMDSNFSLKYGVSITDPCLNWEETKEMLLNAKQQIKSSLATNPKRLKNLHENPSQNSQIINLQ